MSDPTPTQAACKTPAIGITDLLVEVRRLGLASRAEAAALVRADRDSGEKHGAPLG